MPATDLDAALKRSEGTGKKVLLILWNSTEKGNFPGQEMRFFAELQETKKLLRENFIVVLLDRAHPKAKKYLPAGNVEKAQWALLNSKGDVIAQGPVRGTPSAGLETVKQWVTLP